jgi:hypothetical protein
MAMKTNKDFKAIHEVFPIKTRNEINDIRISLGMSWYEFLPFAAKCAKRDCNISDMEEAVNEKRM